jgi:outer membrane protein TolC
MKGRYTMDVHRLRASSPDRMPTLPPNRLRHPALRLAALCATLAWSLLLLAPSAQAQISLTTAVDLALRSNPRVLGAEDDVKKAHAELAEAHDAYVPAITAGAGIGQGYGYLPSPPTLFEVTAGSLVFNVSQFSYIHSAQAGLHAAQLALEDVREQVAEDTALAYIALDHDQQRERTIEQQAGYANTLVTIVQERADAGQDTQIDLTQARLTAAQLRVATLKAQDDLANDREHLARLINLPPASLRTDNSFPANPIPPDAAANPTPNGYANSAVAAAFATAEARRLQAKGDALFRFLPQINLFTQYNRYATFTNSFKTLENLNNSSSSNHIGADEAAFGIQITMPFYDKSRSAKARVSAAEASRAYHDAQAAQIDALDGQSRLRHSISELQAQADVATLQQQLAQQQLDVLHVQLQSGTGNPGGPQMSPKDEQTAHITERDKYLAVLDANFQVRQTEIQLLRQSGSLESWLKSAVQTSPTPNSVPASPAPQP